MPGCRASLVNLAKHLKQSLAGLWALSSTSKSNWGVLSHLSVSSSLVSMFQSRWPPYRLFFLPGAILKEMMMVTEDERGRREARVSCFISCFFLVAVFFFLWELFFSFHCSKWAKYVLILASLQTEDINLKEEKNKTIIGFNYQESAGLVSLIHPIMKKAIILSIHSPCQQSTVWGNSMVPIHRASPEARCKTIPLAQSLFILKWYQVKSGQVGFIVISAIYAVYSETTHVVQHLRYRKIF